MRPQEQGGWGGSQQLSERQGAEEALGGNVMAPESPLACKEIKPVNPKGNQP